MSVIEELGPAPFANKLKVHFTSTLIRCVHYVHAVIFVVLQHIHEPLFCGIESVSRVEHGGMGTVHVMLLHLCSRGCATAPVHSDIGM